MEKGPDWSDEDSVQLCLSWIETSEDPITGTGRERRRSTAGFINIGSNTSARYGRA
ncbi:hypothetical protein GQ600_21996 [Phytophthora cactorum]|nr:hypothetical protein GQ600_21996 [Phytophthora cactorum]